MVLLPETNVLCYIVGAFFLVAGIISFFPNIASKVFKNAPSSRSTQLAGAVTSLILGIGLIILGFVAFS